MASKNTPGWQSFKADYLRENASSFPEAEPPKAAVTWLRRAGFYSLYSRKAPATVIRTHRRYLDHGVPQTGRRGVRALSAAQRRNVELALNWMETQFEHHDAAMEANRAFLAHGAARPNADRAEIDAALRRGLKGSSPRLAVAEKALARAVSGAKRAGLSREQIRLVVRGSLG
jgi:hypothetical protein